MLRNRNGGELEGKGKKASKQKMMVAFVLRDNGTCLYEIFLVPLFFWRLEFYCWELCMWTFVWIYQGIFKVPPVNQGVLQMIHIMQKNLE